MRAREKRSLTTRCGSGDLAPREPNGEETEEHSSRAFPIELLDGARLACERPLEHVDVGALVDLGAGIDVGLGGISPRKRAQERPRPRRPGGGQAFGPCFRAIAIVAPGG